MKSCALMCFSFSNKKAACHVPGFCSRGCHCGLPGLRPARQWHVLQEHLVLDQHPWQCDRPGVQLWQHVAGGPLRSKVHRCFFGSCCAIVRAVVIKAQTVATKVVHYAQQARPRMVLLENVRAIANKRQVEDSVPGTTKLIQMMSDIGYEGSWMPVNSMDYGLPHHRQRVYFFFYLRGHGSSREAALMCQTFQTSTHVSLHQCLGLCSPCSRNS